MKVRKKTFILHNNNNEDVHIKIAYIYTNHVIIFLELLIIKQNDFLVSLHILIEINSDN